MRMLKLFCIPRTGYSSFPDLFQSLGAGYVHGKVRELLAERVFEPLYQTRQLLCSKEGFTFHRPMIVDDLNGEQLVWKPSHLNNSVAVSSSSSSSSPSDNSEVVEMKKPQFRVCGKPQQLSEGHHYDQGVPISVVSKLNDTTNGSPSKKDGISKKQYNKQQKALAKRQKLKDLTGLCYIQASITFTNQTKDKGRGGGHFLAYPQSHTEVHHELVGGTYRATPTPDKDREDPVHVPLTDDEIRRLTSDDGMGCHEKRVYANRGDVILWRSDMVHAGVAPSLIVNKNNSTGDTKYDGPREFRAVQYCCMLPSVSDYIKYSLPKQKLLKNGLREEGTNDAALLDLAKVTHMQHIREEELAKQKLEDYRTGRSGDQRPDTETWHDHRRITMWNMPHSHHKKSNHSGNKLPIPPRMLQRPRYRLGPPLLTLRQAELYGLIPYINQTMEEKQCSKEIERAVIRGVRFVDSVYIGRDINGNEVDSLTIQNGKFCPSDTTINEKESGGSRDIPICFATMEVLRPRSTNGSLLGQDKYLGGMCSPCGRYIYGVPGHAKQVVKVNSNTGEVTFIGPEYDGEFKWLRGVEIPADLMGTNDDGSPAYPSGCCLALPCNSENGCVLKINPHTDKVSTFITGDALSSNAEWMYHGGNLNTETDGTCRVYAIPASAPRVLKIDPVHETTEFIGPEFEGKAKWYGGIVGSDLNIYGIPHNATGVLKINPTIQEVTVLAEGSLPEGLWKWHGGLASQDGSKIIGFPNNADSVLVIDVVKQKVYTVGDSSILRSGYHRVPQDGRYKYLGGSLTANGKYAYLFPCDAEYVLRFDMETDEMKLVGPHLREGENKYQNGFVGSDGCIYGIPQRSSGVLRIIPPGVKRYNRNGLALSDDEEHVDVVYCGDELVSCKDKFEGGVMGANGKIYCIPLRAKHFVNIIPRQR